MKSFHHVLFVPAALMALTVFALPAHAQSDTGVPAAGKALYDDTPGASGISTLTASCINCHTTVLERRQKISGEGGANPQVRFDQAMARLSYALTNVGAMRQFQNLSSDDVRDLGAYLSDTNQVDTGELNFNVAAVNQTSAAQTVTVSAAKLLPAGVVIKKIEILGASLANYSRTFTCDNKTFAQGERCSFTVTFSPRDTSNGSPVLNITMADSSASATTYVRKVILNGTVGGTTPPPAPTAPESDSGGGAMGGAWLAGLAAAALALTRRRRA